MALKVLAFIIFTLVYFTENVRGDVVSRICVVDFKQWVIDVTSQLIWKQEDDKWSRLRLEDATTELNQMVFGTHVEGVTHYSGGFLVSLEKAEIIESSTLYSILSHITVDSVTVSGCFRLHTLKLGWDVKIELTNGTTVYTTAIMPIANAVWCSSVTQSAATGDLTVAVTAVGTQPLRSSDNQNRIIFKPETAIAVLAGVNYVNNMVPFVSNSFGKWATDVFTPKLRKIIEDNFSFPEIRHHC